MADADITNPLGFIDKRKTQGSNSHPVGTVANYKDIAAMKARLTAINATSYTAARLNTMTENDLIYALRLNDDAAGV